VNVLDNHDKTYSPERIMLTAPPHLYPPHVAEAQRRRLAAQPWPGIGGLMLTAVVFFALMAVVALALYGALAAYADGVHWIRAAPDDWITSASLSFAGAGLILHVGIGLRWPFAAAARKDK